MSEQVNWEAKAYGLMGQLREANAEASRLQNDLLAARQEADRARHERDKVKRALCDVRRALIVLDEPSS